MSSEESLLPNKKKPPAPCAGGFPFIHADLPSALLGGSISRNVINDDKILAALHLGLLYRGEFVVFENVEGGSFFLFHFLKIFFVKKNVLSGQV